MSETKSENPYKLPEILLKRFHQLKKIEDGTKKFSRIIELGKKLEDYPESHKTEENLVKGCTSVTYIFGKKESEQMHFWGDSNSSLVKGLLALVIEGCNGKSPEEIIGIDTEFIKAMGLSETLSASRANGFINSIAMIKNICKQNLD